MAITTKSTETLQGIVYGLSDTCSNLFTQGNWTVNELARFSWCRWEDKYMNCVAATDLNISSNQGAAVTNMLSYFQNNGGDLKTKYVDGRITGKPYAFNILMRGNGGDLCLNSDNAANYKVVTSCSDFQKLYVKVDSYNQGSNFNVQHPTARTVKRNSLIWITEGVYNSDNNSYTDRITVWTVIVLDENTFFVTRGMAFPNRTPGLDDGSLGSAQNNIRPSNYLDLDNTPTNDTWRYMYGDIKTYDGSKHLLRWCKNGITNISDTSWTAADQFGCWDIDDNISIFVYGTWGAYRYTYYLRTEDAVKDEIAYTGLRWRYANGDTTHIYTPIIDADGYITGWSTDPEAETKLNDIIDVTGNNISPVPPTPPTPTPGDDDMDLTVMGFSNNIGGAAKYWLLDSAPDGLFQDFFLHAPQGSSLTNNLLSCYVSALNWAWQTVDHKMVIYTNGSQEPAFESVASYKYIYQSNPHKVLGYFEVERPTGTFLDFSPFSTYELYVPFCGWIGLPDTVAGRTIRVYMDFDASVCSCKARILMEANGGDTIIGEISGTFGAPCPIQVVEGGLYRQAVVNSALQIASGVAQGTYGASVGAGALAISGFSSAMNGLAGAASANNTNFSQTIGRTGDTSNLCGGHYCKIRITHPVFDEVVNNSLFGHTVGYLVNEVGKIKDFKGFTVCGNPHVHGIDCTESEKEEIKRLLEEGIIIN